MPCTLCPGKALEIANIIIVTAIQQGITHGFGNETTGLINISMIRRISRGTKYGKKPAGEEYWQIGS